MIDHEPKPRLVVAANSFWNLQNFRGGLIRELARQGFDLTLVAAPHDSAGDVGMPGRQRSLPMRSHGLDPFADTRLVLRIAALLRQERAAALLSWTAKPNIYGALAARFVGIPALPNVSGLGTAFIRGGVLQAVLSSLYRAAFARCPAVFFQNSEDSELFIAKRLVRREQVRLLPGSGVDLVRFEFKPMPTEDRGLRLLFVGRLLGDKGLRELAAAARILKRENAPLTVQLLGFTGAENRSAISASELETWVAEGIVSYLGDTHDVRPFLAQAHAVVLPSYREGLPRSLLEAAAVGRPLLASDVPGCREVVEAQVNGLLFPAGSPAGLADAIRHWLDLSTQERSAMGQAARRTAEQRFSEQQVVAAYLHELGALIGARQE